MRVLIIILLTSVIKLSNAQGPAIFWAKNFGGSGGYGSSIKFDAGGNLYSAGAFSGAADFDPGPGSFTLSAFPGFGSDAFISKLDGLGNLIWAKKVSGPGDELVLSIAIDAIGNVYACGIFSVTTDFDPGPGSFSLTSNGCYDAFILKLDPSGNFLWAKSFGSSNHDYAYNLTLGANENLHVCGSFVGTVDFDPGVGTYNLTGPDDAFILKLDKDGNFIWAKNIGGTVGASARALSLDGTGNIFITGPYAGIVDFDPNAGNYTLTSSGQLDVFVEKLDNSGNFIWAKGMGGVENEDAFSLALDQNGNVLTTGYFKGDADFDPGAGTFSLSASTFRSHIYVYKLDNNVNFVWAKSFVGDGAGGSPKNNMGHSIAVDGSGNVFTTGEFEGNIDFDPGASTVILSSFDNKDIFISKLDANGNYVWVGRMGGASNSEVGSNISIDSFGNIFATGSFYGTSDFDPNSPIYNLTGGGSFILKMAPCCAGFEEFNANKNFIRVYPNPNSGEFSIDVPQEEKNVRVVLYNLMGQIVFTQSLNEGINTIQTKLSKGLYLARLQGDTFTSEAAKVIVE